jgi:hypothetical protein
MSKLDEALAEPDLHEMVSKIVSYVSEKARMAGWDSLTDTEKTVSLADSYRFRLTAGGLSTTVVWDPPDYRDQAIAAIERIGAKETSSILRRAAALVDAIHRSKVPLMTVGDVLDAMGPAYAELRSNLEQAWPEVEIGDCLATWLDANRSAWRTS